MPAVKAVIPVKISTAGLSDIAIFHAYCAAVASVISPVNAPTAICLSVIVPSDAASARLSAVTDAACDLTRAVIDEMIFQAFHAVIAVVTIGKSILRLSAIKSIAFASGGITTFAMLVIVLPRLINMVLTVLIAFLRPPFSKDFLIVLIASLTGVCSSFGNNLTKFLVKASTILFAADSRSGARSLMPLTNVFTMFIAALTSFDELFAIPLTNACKKDIAASIIFGAASTAFVASSPKIEPASSIISDNPPSVNASVSLLT